MPPTLSTARARRIALTAQGLNRLRLDRTITMGDVQRQINRLALLQIDSINVVARAQYLPLFSRLGDYDPGLLDRAAHRRPRRLFEYWGHAASLIDVSLYPALRFRMAAAGQEAWGRIRSMPDQHPQLLAELERVVAEHGPVTAREAEVHLALDLPDRTREHWGWNWSLVKVGLEWLFWSGVITSAFRNSQFERAYLPTGRVLPTEVVQAPALTRQQAAIELVSRSLRALGVAETGEVADYFRLPKAVALDALQVLRDQGQASQVLVDDRPHWLSAHAKASEPRTGGTLFSPFDSMVFERGRLSRLFDFDYRIEIYVPQAKRRYGYYVYPFLWRDRFAARVDLRADRPSRTLQIKGCWYEPGHDRTEVRDALSEELGRLAAWLKLDRLGWLH